MCSIIANNNNETYIMRIMRDLKEFYSSNMEDISIVAEEEDISVIHALLRGPELTPYQNGFFYFTLRFPTDYPIRPPDVKLMTTGEGKVRFNPNLYSNGKVCLSILGTWSGPAWSAANTLLTILLSIQSLMNEKPFHNEPGFEEKTYRSLRRENMASCVQNYNEIISHETLRIAVIGMLEENSSDARNMPQVLKDVMICSFKKNYHYFEDLIKSKFDMDGQTLRDPFGDSSRPKFQYISLLERLQKLKVRFNITDDNGLQTTGAVSSDPALEPYFQIASKYMSISTKSEPKPEEQTDNWDDIIDDMNEELNEDVEEYSEGSDDDNELETQPINE